MEYVLIRTSENQIKGPYEKEKICQMILDGKLSASDEICFGNSYWISLHETTEIKQIFGIDVPLEPLLSDQEEITLVKEFVLDEPTQPNLTNSISNLNQQGSDFPMNIKTAVLSENQLREIRSYRNHTPVPIEVFQKKSRSRAVLKSGLMFGGALVLILLFYYLSTLKS